MARRYRYLDIVRALGLRGQPVVYVEDDDSTVHGCPQTISVFLFIIISELLIAVSEFSFGDELFLFMNVSVNEQVS